MHVWLSVASDQLVKRGVLEKRSFPSYHKTAKSFGQNEKVCESIFFNVILIFSLWYLTCFHSHTHTHTHTHMHSAHTHTHTLMHSVHTHKHAHAYTYIHTYICIVYTQTRRHTYMHAYTHTYALTHA